MKKLNYLHCVQDTHFTEYILEEFEYVREYVNSYYVVCSFRKCNNLRFIGNLSQIEFIHPLMLNKYIKVKQIDVVVLHNILSLHYLNILNLPSTVKIVWFAWGKDIYSIPTINPFINIKLYAPLTTKYLGNNINSSFKKSIKDKFQNYFLWKVIRKIDYFSGVLPQEYTLMKQINGFRAKEVFFHYTSFSEETTNDELDMPDGYNILIGNSGDPSNNHLDVFEKLSKADVSNRKIYAPLSYGGDKDYIKKVIDDGKRKWGDKFVPITNYVPYEDYKNILRSCSFFIFSHERQQAMGNIGISIKAGGKVFLSETSIVYKYYKNIGMNVYSIQDDLRQIGLNNKLSYKEMTENIRLMKKYRSASVFYQDLIKTINIIQND